jgi:D-tyrosyl-tRNA(Tyr) deacylase
LRLVLQRVSRASVSVGGEVVGQIDRGLLVFVGVASGDGPADIAYATSKVCEIRVFPDDDGRMNRSVVDIGGALLVISQFTLLGDARKGRRPAFDQAAPPTEAEAVYEALVGQLAASGLPVATGQFRAHMVIEATNDGPVTMLLDSRRTF